MTTKQRYVTAVAPGPAFHVGIVTEDGRCRVDYHGPLEDLSFWETSWFAPDNPWLGGVIRGEALTDLVAAYS